MYIVIFTNTSKTIDTRARTKIKVPRFVIFIILQLQKESKYRKLSACLSHYMAGCYTNAFHGFWTGFGNKCSVS